MAKKVFALAGLAGLVLSSGVASAQFVHGVTQPATGTNPPAVFLTDAGSGSSTFLFNATSSLFPATAPGFGGLAADEAGGRLLASVRNGAQDDIWQINYVTFSTTKLSTVKRPGTTTGMSVEGLAYDTVAGKLYGTRVLGGSAGAEGLFRIDPLTGDTTLFLEYEPTTTSLYSISAIDFDPLTKLIYLVDEDDTGGRNIYSVDPQSGTPALNLVAALPLPITDVDGLAAGNGKLYLVSDGPDIASTAGIEGNGGNHYVFDIASSTFSILGPTTYPEYSTSSFGRINPSAGAAFAPGLIPEPSSLGLLIPGLLLLKRRKS
jgi:hypothetical protein